MKLLSVSINPLQYINSTIRELDIGDDPKVYLAITIHLKLNGYAPKYSIEYLRKINTGEKQKASHSKNDLLNGGGEGAKRAVCTIRSEYA